MNTSRGVPDRPPLAWPHDRPDYETPLVGRITEFGDLLRVVKESSRGELRVVLLEGDPGTGKTRLVRELSLHAERLGLRALYGRAKEFERGLPYGAIRSALEGVVEQSGDDDWSRQLPGPDLASLRVLLPSLFSSRSPSGGKARGGAANAKLAAALSRLLITWSDDRPVMLAIDDAHWLDESSVQLLHLLAGRLESSSVVLLLAYRGRPPELQPGPGALLRELSCFQSSLSVQLGALDEWDAAAMVEQLLGIPVDPSVVSLLMGATAGNPFFIREVTRALSESGELVIEGGHVVLGSELRDSLPIPLTARAVVARRLAALGPTTVAVARAVAAAKSVELDSTSKAAVVEASGLDQTAFDRGLDDLCRAGILAVVDSATLEFANPLIRTLVYDELGVTERRSFHRRLADALEKLRAAGHTITAFEIAFHAAQCARAGDAVCIRRLAAAGDETFEHAPKAAADWFAKALALRPTDNPSKASLHRRRTQALTLAGSLSEAVKAGREALVDLPVGAERTSIATTIIGILNGLGQYEEALREVDVAVAEAREGGRGRLLAHRVRILSSMGRLREARACVADALEVISDDLPARTLALCELAEIALVQGRLDEHDAAFTEVLELTQRVPASGRVLSESMPEASRVLIRSVTAGHLAVLGALDAAAALLSDADREAKEHGIEIFAPVVLSGLANVAWMRGAWDEAITSAETAIRESQQSGAVTPAVVWTPLIAIATDRGEITAASRHLEFVRKLEASRGRELGAEYLVWCQARLARVQGRPADAVAALEDELRRCQAEDVVKGQLFILDELVAAYCEVADEGSAKQPAAELADLAAHLDLPFTRALADRAELRAAGDIDAGQRARQRFADLGMGFERAQTELLLARLLRDGALAESASVEFHGLRADPWVRRTRALMKELGLSGSRKQRRPRTEPSSLSDLEAQIASLVAQGLTNRDVGGVLALSPKTVENYLSRIYRKVGCTSRTQLVAAWLERAHPETER